MENVYVWCVAKVRSGSEENIRVQCKEKISPDIILDCYVFYYEEKRHIRGTWVIQEKVLFPGYVFFVTEEAEKLKEELSHIHGISELLENDGNVVSLAEEDVYFLKMFGGEEQTVVLSEGVIEKSKLRVYAGPLMGKEQYIRKIDRHKRKALLEMPIFGKVQKMQVGLEVVSKT